LEHLGNVILPGALFATNPPAFPYSSLFSYSLIPIKNPLRIESKKDERKRISARKEEKKERKKGKKRGKEEKKREDGEGRPAVLVNNPGASRLLVGYLTS
jgi:hypothetical protein